MVVVVVIPLCVIPHQLTARRAAAAAVASHALFRDTPPGELTAGLCANVVGPLLLCRLVLPDMLAAGDGGVIVNVSSVCGLVALPGAASYCAAKAALNAFGTALRAELAGTRVSVVTVCPSGIVGAGMYAELKKELAADRRRLRARCVRHHCASGASIRDSLR